MEEETWQICGCMMYPVGILTMHTMHTMHIMYCTKYLVYIVLLLARVHKYYCIHTNQEVHFPE